MSPFGYGMELGPRTEKGREENGCVKDGRKGREGKLGHLFSNRSPPLNNRTLEEHYIRGMKGSKIVIIICPIAIP